MLGTSLQRKVRRVSNVELELTPPDQEQSCVFRVLRGISVLELLKLCVSPDISLRREFLSAQFVRTEPSPTQLVQSCLMFIELSILTTFNVEIYSVIIVNSWLKISDLNFRTMILIVYSHAKLLLLRTLLRTRSPCKKEHCILAMSS